jgi:hypothetical protein
MSGGTDLPVSPSTAERHCTFVDGAGGEPLGSNPKYPVVRIWRLSIPHRISESQASNRAGECKAIQPVSNAFEDAAQTIGRRSRTAISPKAPPPATNPHFHPRTSPQCHKIPVCPSAAESR